MEQKDYKMEIVLNLLKKDNHIREIGRELSTNHMLIQRRMQDLLKNNVVDFREEGKNKVCFLKKTVETYSYIIMAEQYNLTKILNKYPLLRNIIEKIQKDNRIKLALLFGSYAKELAKKDSDIDIYIETEDRDIKREYSIIDSRLSIKIGKYNKEDNLIKEIEKNHIIIKGAEEYYEKNEFFG